MVGLNQLFKYNQKKRSLSEKYDTLIGEKWMWKKKKNINHQQVFFKISIILMKYS